MQGHLEAIGLYDDTLIIVTSDHGEEFGEHGSVGRHGHTLYDELLRVPLLVKLPGARHGGESFDGLARLIDVAPTILGALDPQERFNVAAAHPHEVGSLAGTARIEMRAAEPRTQVAEPSPDLVERLRAIGYVGE